MEPENKALPEPVQRPSDKFCTDCMKTKGFAITVPLTILAITIGIAMIFGIVTVEMKWVLFAMFWGFCMFLTGFTYAGSLKCLKIYCTPSSADYKDPGAVVLFAILLVVAVLGTVVIVQQMPLNYEWMTGRDF